MGKQFLDKSGLITLWNKIKSVFATKASLSATDNQVNTLVNTTRELTNRTTNLDNNKMNNGIIQTYRGREVSFKTEGNQNSVYFNFRSEQSTPITRFLFGKGTADGQYADIYCGNLVCANVNAYNTLLFNGDEARMILKSSQAEYPLITFKADTVEPYGHGILIGGGGSVVVGAGESANVVFNGSITGPSAPGDECLRLSANDSIYFYPGQQDGFNDKGTYINNNGEYFMNNKKVATEDKLNSFVYIDKNAETMRIGKIGATDELHILKRNTLSAGIGFTIHNPSNGSWKEYPLPETQGRLVTSPQLDEKITKGDLVFSLSGSTLTITKRY